MLLIVDDDPNLQQLHALYLNAAGYNTLCANNGIQNKLIAILGRMAA